MIRSDDRLRAIWYLPVPPVKVRNVCGAGVTVFAALAVALITRKLLRKACRAAMGKAGDGGGSCRRPVNHLEDFGSNRIGPTP
jgi:sugar/nucleoside kinase (ribokinase family)